MQPNGSGNYFQHHHLNLDFAKITSISSSKYSHEASSNSQVRRDTALESEDFEHTRDQSALLHITIQNSLEQSKISSNEDAVFYFLFFLVWGGELED